MLETIKQKNSRTIRIAGLDYVLEGEISSLGEKLVYHQSFSIANSVGAVDSILSSVSTALGCATFATSWKSLQKQITEVPILDPIVGRLESSTIKITDLVIDTFNNKYQFGFALDFSNAPVTLADFPIELDAFGLKLIAEKK